MENLLLSDGFRLPAVGFGTYKLLGETGYRAILSAIRAGYRFFDTASLYGTEENLGRAIRDSGIPREEFVVETKLWIDERGYEGAKAALSRSLGRLGMEYVDLYLIHWPRATGAPDEDWVALNRETWRAMEEAADEGLARRLGVSNFLPHHLRPLLDGARIRPAVDQLELHAGYLQETALAYCRENGIQPLAWSPLARGQEADGLTRRLAEKYGRSPQQIQLRFLLQRGILPLPKAVQEAHIRENLQIFDFALTEEEVSMLSCLPQAGWLGEHPDFSIPAKRLF